MIGRIPTRQEPSATPVMAFSATGMSNTRFAPCFSRSPLVVPNTPIGSGTPNPITYVVRSRHRQMTNASWMASANLSGRSVTNGAGSGEHVAAELRPLGKRTSLRERHSIIDLRRDRRFERGVERVVDDAIVLEQLAVQADRTTVEP